MNARKGKGESLILYIQGVQFSFTNSYLNHILYLVYNLVAYVLYLTLLQSFHLLSNKDPFTSYWKIIKESSSL